MKYSIITPVFNRADCVLRCLESVSEALQRAAAQGMDCDVEHIVVDDGSKDSTPRLVTDYAQSHPHIRFMALARNRGTNAARNAAIRIATGHYGIILDSDDHLVPDALCIIHQTVSTSRYRHYLFAPDDMMSVYGRMGLTTGTVLSYEDFLRGGFIGDFVHVVDLNIMKAHPFEESIRIYESIFLYYRDAGQMLFHDDIVTLRDRGRSDSVSFEMIRLSKRVIGNKLKAAQLQIENFGEDYRRLLLTSTLDGLFAEVFDNALLLGDYTAANEAYHQIQKPQGKKIALARLFYHLHAATLYRWCLYSFLWVKYRLRHHHLTIS